MIVLYILLLLIIAAISKSIMDVISFRYDQSIFCNSKYKNWFNPKESSKNKYKDNNPEKGEKFFGSTTFLVWITDAWHFFQMIMLSSFQIIIILFLNKILFLNYEFIKLFFIDISLFIFIKIVFGIIFELFWNKILLKK